MRISKYLDLAGITPQQVEENLDADSNRLLDSSSSESDFVQFDPTIKKATRASGDPDATESEHEVKNENTPKANFVRQEDGTNKELEEYLTFGELAGRIPTSLIPKIDFQKFVKSNKLPVMEE